MENRHLRILHVIPYHSSASSFIFAKRQVEDLSDLGHQNEVFYFKTTFSIWGFFKQLSALRKLVNEQKPQIIHAHYGTINAYFASRIKEIPLVVSFHGSDLNYTNDVHWIREKLGKLLSRIAAEHARKIICVSNQLQRNLPVGIEKSTVIPSGVDTRRFKKMNKQECKKNLGLSESINYIFFNANNPIIKRLDIALDVVEQLKDYHIELLSLKGNVNPDEIPTYLNASNVVLLCSDSEGSPMVIKEALACGVPIVSTDVGDVKSTINEVDHCFIVPQDSIQLAAKIQYLIERGATSTNGLSILKARKLDYLSSIKKVEEVYFSAINQINR